MSSSPASRVRTSSESSEGGEAVGAMAIPNKSGVAYDMDGKFSYSQVGAFVRAFHGPGSGIFIDTSLPA